MCRHSPFIFLEPNMTQDKGEVYLADNIKEEPKSNGNPASLGLLLTDLGNAKRLVAWYKDRLRYVVAEKQWFVFDGKRWISDEREQALEFAKETVIRIYSEAEGIEDDYTRKRLQKWATASLDRRRLEAMLALSRSEKGIAATPLDFDHQHPLYINTSNGTLCLNTMKLHPLRAEDMLTNLAPVECDPEAESELWEFCLHSWTGGDESKEQFLQKAAGLALAGNTEEEFFVALVGPGGSGKSTFMSALLSVFGSYGRTAQFQTFLRASNSRTGRDDLADLVGSRLVVANEASKTATFDEALVKTITGGDNLRVRHLYARSFEYRPTFILFLACNRLPNFDMTDSGMRRRIRVVPFEEKIRPDPIVKRELTDPSMHGSAILNWCLSGLKKYDSEGLGDDFTLKDTPWSLFG